MEVPLEEIQEQSGFYGSSPQVEELLQTVVMVAPTDLSVLINGESGTGKELIAKAIHNFSHRHDKSLISVNCGAIPEGILESELFGHEKGSFTGAISQKKGYFEVANNGTIFLDEIGEMPLNTQVKLLRVLESSEFMRVGGTTLHKVDVRIIAATNKNLEKAVQNNEFRRDLFYRLKAITLEIPPLRERKEDIPILTEIFVDDYKHKNNIDFKGFSPDSILLIKEHHWEGNVRELRNFIETAIILNKGEVVRSEYVRSALNIESSYKHSESLPVPVNKTPEQAERELIYRTLISLKLDINEIKQMLAASMGKGLNFDTPDSGPVYDDEEENDQEVKTTTLTGMERELIKETLRKYDDSRRKTARALQISERTLYRKIREYGL
jgi:transcriptional regulator with PAS, ATPase and Fis domain